MKSVLSFIGRLLDEPRNNPPSTSGSGLSGHDDTAKGKSSAATAKDNSTQATPRSTGTDGQETSKCTPAANTTGDGKEIPSLQLSPNTNLDSEMLKSDTEQTPLQLSPSKDLDFEMLTLDECRRPPQRRAAEDDIAAAKSELFKDGQNLPANNNPPQPEIPPIKKLKMVIKNPPSNDNLESEMENENLRWSDSSPEPENNPQKSEESNTKKSEVKENQNPSSNDNSRLQRENPPVEKPGFRERESRPCVQGAGFVEFAEEVVERRPTPRGQLFCDFIKESFPAPAKPPASEEMVDVEDFEINPYPAAQRQSFDTPQNPGQSRNQTRGQKKSNQNRESVEVDDSEINPYQARRQTTDASQFSGGQPRNQPKNKQKKNKGGNQNWRKAVDVQDWDINPNLAQNSRGQQNMPNKFQNRGNPPQQNGMQRPPNMLFPWNVPSNSSWVPSQRTNTESKNCPGKWQTNQGGSYNAAARPGGSSYRKPAPRGLYKASSMQELENNAKRFEFDFTRKPQDLLRLSKTFVQYGDENLENGDEERAYLEYMKYVRMCMQAMQYPHIQIDTSNLQRCMANTDKLTESLKARYGRAPTQQSTTQSVPSNNFQLGPIFPSTIPVLPTVPLPPSTTPSLPSADMNPQLILAQLLTSQLLTTPAAGTQVTQAALTPQEIAAQFLTNQSGGNSLNTLLALAASLSAQNNNTTTSNQPGTAPVVPTPLIPAAVPTVTPLVPEVVQKPSTSAQIKPATTKTRDEKSKTPRRQQVDVSDEESEEEEEEVMTVPGTEGGPWKRGKGGQVPVGAVEGGKNHHGPIYVARMQHAGKQVPGKLIPEYGSCYITWKTKEVKSKDYEVLCDNNVGWMKVKEGSPSSIPRNAIFGGCDENGKPLYIGRAKHTPSVTVGKVEGDSMKCLVLYGNAEHEFKDFELLVSVNPSGRGGQQASSRSGYSSRPSRSSDDSSNSGAYKNRGRGQNQSKNSGKSSGGGFFSSWGKQRSGGEEQQEIVKASVLTESFTKHMPAMKLLDGSTVQENFKLTALAINDKDYIHVSQKMQGTIATHPGIALSQYTIAKIEKVWNTKLWSMYAHSLKKIKSENNNKVNERRLFHGSGKCLDIVEKGFDERHARPGMFGSDHSSKSHQYASGTPKMMMLCRVALGNVKEHTTAFNSYSHAPPGYHSVKGVPGTSLKYAEYIVYRGEQALPEFLITYS